MCNDLESGKADSLRLFVTYRREDSSAYAGRLNDALVGEFGDDHVFQDVSTIAPGQDFEKAVDAALGVSDTVLVVVGPGWLAPGSDGVARIHQPEDFVRLEISRAIDRDLRIIPVLVGGAALPAEQDLPEPLQSLSKRQAVRLSDETWREDVDRLVKSLRGEPPSRSRPRIWRAAIVAAVLIIAAVGITSVLDGEEDGPASESSECDQPAETTWTRLVGPDATASATVVAVDGSFDFVVTDAHFRLLGEGIYEVVLQTVMTNNTPVEVAHGDWRYDHLEVNRFPFPEQTCFSAVQTLLNEEQSSRAMVGFEVTEEPGGPLRLIVEEEDDQAIIDLDSSG